MSADNLPRPATDAEIARLERDVFPPSGEEMRSVIARFRQEQRRMDAVREWAESMPDAYPESLLAADEEHGARIYASGMCNAAAMVLEILGDGEDAR